MECGERMLRFCSIIENDKYKIGCTGQTVCVLDKNDTVLSRFKDLTYAYRAAISPRGDIFVIKSTKGQIAVYSLKTMSLIEKFRFSKVNYSQDDGFCFSRDGKFLLNIARWGDDLHSAILIYDTTDFSTVSSLFPAEKIMVSHIQEVDGAYFVLGYMRNDDMVCCSFFISKYLNNDLCDVTEITKAEYDFYDEHLKQTMFGLGLSDDREIKSIHTLGKLWALYHQNQ